MLISNYIFKISKFTKGINQLANSIRMTSDFANIRAHYRDPSETFDIKDLASKDPIEQFANWFQEARKNPNIKEPNAMCISTATKDGKPSSRIVLMKDYSDKGFTFFTNYNSRKGNELSENPHCSICFYWDVISRQVRIDGTAIKIPREESETYFSKRPFNSRISALISDQSKVIKDKQVLIDLQKEATAKYEKDNVVPTPDFWGGYLVKPEVIEFWQGNDIRLHDRIRFRKAASEEKLDPAMFTQGEKGWIIERLSP